MPLPRSSLRFSGVPLPSIEPSGEAGRDNAAVYAELLGLSAYEVAGLARDGVI